MAIESMTVIPSEMRSPDLAGKTNTKKIMHAIRAHGTTRFMIKKKCLRRMVISNLMVLCGLRWMGYFTCNENVNKVLCDVYVAA